MNTISLKANLGYVIAGLAVLFSLAAFAPAFAQSTTATPPQGGAEWSGAAHAGGRMPGGFGQGFGKNSIFGTVASINGSTLTVTSKAFGPRPESGTTATPPAPVTYTVNATNATVTKNGAASTLSAVAVGDTVMVQGTVSGTSVTATAIRDGMPTTMNHTGNPPQKPVVVPGNGEPVVGGAITAINGNSITITNKSNVTYTIDASSATIVKNNATSTISSLAVGDNVVVQGTVSGNNIAAYSVTDSGAANTSSTPATPGKGFGGFLQSIGGFFHNLFGFF